MTTNFHPAIGKATQWKKGQPSPNPGGRPRSRVLTEALRAELGKVSADDPQHRTHAEVIAANMVRIACSKDRGAVAAASEIADRVEGRSVQSIQISDVVADLHSRSDEELSYFVEHGRWPDYHQLPVCGGQEGVSTQ